MHKTPLLSRRGLAKAILVPYSLETVIDIVMNRPGRNFLKESQAVRREKDSCPIFFFSFSL